MFRGSFKIRSLYFGDKVALNTTLTAPESFSKVASIDIIVGTFSYIIHETTQNDPRYEVVGTKPFFLTGHNAARIPSGIIIDVVIMRLLFTR